MGALKFNDYGTLIYLYCVCGGSSNSVESSPDTSTSTFIHHQKISSFQASLKLDSPNEQNISTASLSTKIASIDIKNTTVSIDQHRSATSSSTDNNNSLTTATATATTTTLQRQVSHEMKPQPLSTTPSSSMASTINKATSNLKNNFVDLDFFNEEEDYQEDECKIFRRQGSFPRSMSTTFGFFSTIYQWTSTTSRVSSLTCSPRCE